MKLNKYLLFTICFVLIITLCFCLIKPNNKEDLMTNDIKQELIENKGSYDENTLVLKGTNTTLANDIANRLNAKLRITKDGSFATLTLKDQTVFDVISNSENKDILEYLSIDYKANISEIEEVEEEYVTKPSKYVPNDNLYSYQSYLNYLNLDNVWQNHSGWGITVAVIDTGIDTDHTEFSGKISEYSYNATEDKIIKDYYDENGNYDWSLIEDEQGHGTAVTGVIAASMDGNGIVGISPDVTILTIKVDCDESGTFYRTSDLVFGLYYAIEQDVNVVNMSFGGGINLYSDAARLAVDSDIVLVAASGNESTSALTYPAADENVIGVGALAENSFELANYSNYGENNDIVAPGTVYTTKNDGTYAIMNGTSFSSPIVASTIALYQSANGYTLVNDLKERLFASTIDLGALSKDYYFGYGALDVKPFILDEVGTVTFNYLTDEIEETKQVFIRNHTLQSLPEPERLYSVFDGWYYDIECTEELQYYEDIFNNDITLYAKWANEDDSVPYTYVILDDNTVEIRGYTGHRRYITIPDYIDGKVVSSIGDGAFKNQNRLREINLPQNLTKIGISAFEGCSNLLKVNVPDTVLSIGEYAFKDCIRVQEVIFTDNCKLKEIKNEAFSNCASISRFDIPKNVNIVDGTSFIGTTSLKEINVHRQNKYFTSVSGVLFNKTKNTLVAYPAGIKQSYSVPHNVKTIGVAAFAYTKEDNIDLSNIIRIEDYAFINSNVKSVIIPDTTTNLGMFAFSSSFNLSNVIIGKKLNSISAYAFNNCLNLQDIIIPNNIISIDNNAFEGSNLSNISFESNSKLLSIDDNAFARTSIKRINIPKTVVSIGNNAFYYTPFLAELSFEDGSNLYEIGSNAFAKTYDLTVINFPSNLAIIGDYAFAESSLSESITLPNNLEKLGVGVFASCDNLSYIYVENENKHYTDIDGVVYSKNGDLLVAYPVGNPRTSYIINDVSTIKEAAFYGATHINEIILPDTLNSIEQYAFAYNTNLLTVSIPKNVVQIGKYAFSNDYNLSSITFAQDSIISRISYAAFAYTGISSIVIPASVSTIAQEAFIGSSNLKQVIFAANSTLETIPAYMFKGSNNIQSIIFEAGSNLTSISAHGFEGMNNLVSIDFGDAKLINIDNFAFRYCNSLSNIIIPETVNFIGRYAFYGCTNLSSLVIPEAIDYIGSNAFYGADNLNLYFESNQLPINLQLNWDNGISGYYVGVVEILENEEFKYAILKDNTIGIIKYLGNSSIVDLSNTSLQREISQIGGYAFYRSNITSIILPSTLQIIGQYAFANSKVEEILLPNSVSYIAKYAFYNSALSSIEISENSELEKIEQYAFASCDYLSNIYIPSNVKVLEKGIFKDSKLSNVSFGNNSMLTYIPEDAFLGTSLGSINLPNNINKIDHNAFRDIKTLQTVIFGTSELQIMSNVFYNTGLTEINIPSNVTYIGEYSFVGLQNLTNFNVDENNVNYKDIDGVLFTKDGKKLISFPASRTGSYEINNQVETIGFGAFENSSLTSITFAENINLLTIGYRAFFNAKNLTEINIPASVVSIDYYAFAYCESLQKVNFAVDNRLTGIYEGAFYGCKVLKDILLPDSIIEISDYSFTGCKKLESLPVSSMSNLKGIYSYAFAYSGLKDLVIPETVIDIEKYAFKGVKIKNLVIPGSNKNQLIIGIGAFEDCNKLESITLPFVGATFEDSDITWIGYIFGAGSYEANNTYIPQSLKEIVLYEGLTELGDGAFFGLTNINKVLIPSTVQYIKETTFADSTFEYELVNTIYIDAIYERSLGTGIHGNLDVNVEYDNVYLNNIGNLNSIKLSNNITYIDLGGNVAKNVYLPEELKSIQLSAFNKMNLYFPGSLEAWCALEVINNFVCNYNLYIYGEDNSWVEPKEIVIPYSIKEINECAFTGINNIEEIILHNEVEKIGSLAFASCTSLRQIYLPNGLKEIGISAFSGCINLKKITIPETVNTLKPGVFGGCINLESVDIKSNIKEISNSMFNGCYALREIILPETIEIIDENAFGYCYSLSSITIPANTKYIADDAFQFCTSLVEIYNNSDLIFDLDEKNLNEFDICYWARILYNKDGSVKYKFDNNVTYIRTENNFIFRQEYGEYTLDRYLGNEQSVELPGKINGETINYTFGASLWRDSFSGGNIESIYISEHVPSGITYETLRYLDSLTHIQVSDKNPYYFYSNGVLYEKVEDNLKAIFIIKTVKDVIFEPNTIDYYDLIFESLTNIETLYLPDLPIDINNKHVYVTNCLNLKKLYIADYVTSITISTCPVLKHIEIDENNDSIILIDSFVCQKINDKLTIESVLKTIEPIVVIPEYVEAISSEAFGSCNNITSITIPEKITEIPVGAFYGCINLKYVNILGDVTTINANAFNGCINLEKINIPNTVSYIGGSAFQNCKNLLSINLPDLLTIIEPFTFANCIKLKNICIPNNVYEIGSFAFSDCICIDTIYIPNSVKIIDLGAFDDAYEVDNVYYDGTIEDWCMINNFVTNGIINPQKFYTKNEFNEYELVTNLIIPENITTIPKSRFVSFNQFKTITLHNGISSIENYAFYGIEFEEVYYDGTIEEWFNIEFGDLASPTTNVDKFYIKNINNEYELVRELFIPEGVNTIPEGLFSRYDSLLSITLPSTLTLIEDHAFSECYNLKEIYNYSSINIDLQNLGSNINGGIANYAEILYYENGNKVFKDGDALIVETVDLFRFIYKNNAYKLISYCGEEREIELPRYINGSIYAIELQYDVNLKKIFIPNTINHIDDSAFYGCKQLSSIVVPESVNSIGSNAFAYCENLEELIFENSENITDIGWNILEGTQIYNNKDNWENGLLYIGTCLVAIDENVKKDLTYLEIKENTTAIEHDIISNLYNLKHLKVNNINITNIRGLSNLETLEISNGSINDYSLVHAFNYDLPLTLRSFILGENVDVLSSHGFDLVENANIYVNKGNQDVMWDQDYINWSNGNKVYYKGEWIKVQFFDINNDLLNQDYYTVNQVIRQPFIENFNDKIYLYEFVGWDINNDGVADTIPATSKNDITARAVYEQEIITYNVSFIDKDGETVLYSYQSSYGEKVALPAVPTKKGYTFVGWVGYEEDIIVNSDLKFNSIWIHEGQGHDYSLVENVDSTCEDSGYTKHICSICDEWYATDYQNPIGHNYVDSIIESTCEEQGYTNHKCINCDNEYKDNYQDLKNHNYGDWIVEVESTCSSDGLQKRVCINCEHFETTIISASGHEYNVSVIEESTCTTLGKEKYTCIYCDEEVIQELPLASHDYQKKYASKSLIQYLLSFILNVFYGYDDNNAYYYQCSICSQVLIDQENVSSSIQGVCNHENCEWVVGIEANHNEEGFMFNECQNCQDIIAVMTIEKNNNHSYKSVVTAPTCTEKGYTTHTCQCGDTYIDSYVEALGHDIIIDERVEATCTETGLTEGEHCSRCDYKVAQEIIPAKGHKESAVVVENNVLPTCVTKGSYDNVIYCSECSEELERVTIIVDELGHTYESVVTLPTCTEKGYTTHTCHCGDTYIDSYVDKLGHDIIIDELVEATCTETGLTEGEHCSRCDHKVAQEVIPAKGHKESDWIIDKEATTTSEGNKHKECTECGTILSEQIIEKLPSNSSNSCLSGSIVHLVTIFNMLAACLIIFRKRN